MFSRKGKKMRVLRGLLSITINGATFRDGGWGTSLVLQGGKKKMRQIIRGARRDRKSFAGRKRGKTAKGLKKREGQP